MRDQIRKVVKYLGGSVFGSLWRVSSERPVIFLLAFVLFSIFTMYLALFVAWLASVEQFRTSSAIKSLFVPLVLMQVFAIRAIHSIFTKLKR